jgi:thiamine biosynthesis protein ThiS
MPLPRKPPPKQQPPPPPPAPPRLALLLNGEPHEVAADATVLDLVTGLGRDPRTVAVERNGELVPRAAFPATRLAAGDRLEVVHFVQGGWR